MSEIWVGPDGSVLTGIHSATACEGRGCPIHHPSDHGMRDWPLHYRNDRALMERLCRHGVGHPDPDDLAYNEMLLPGSIRARAIHGCCGCCSYRED
jgi:hypothetical protein